MNSEDQTPQEMSVVGKIISIFVSPTETFRSLDQTLLREPEDKPDPGQLRGLLHLGFFAQYNDQYIGHHHDQLRRFSIVGAIECRQLRLQPGAGKRRGYSFLEVKRGKTLLSDRAVEQGRRGCGDLGKGGYNLREQLLAIRQIVLGQERRDEQIKPLQCVRYIERIPGHLSCRIWQPYFKFRNERL